jgi:hypothetical protein
LEEWNLTDENIRGIDISPKFTNEQDCGSGDENDKYQFVGHWSQSCRAASGASERVYDMFKQKLKKQKDQLGATSKDKVPQIEIPKKNSIQIPIYYGDSNGKKVARAGSLEGDGFMQYSSRPSTAKRTLPCYLSPSLPEYHIMEEVVVPETGGNQTRRSNRMLHSLIKIPSKANSSSSVWKSISDLSADILGSDLTGNQEQSLNNLQTAARVLCEHHENLEKPTRNIVFWNTRKFNAAQQANEKLSIKPVMEKAKRRQASAQRGRDQIIWNPDLKNFHQGLLLSN